MRLGAPAARATPGGRLRAGVAVAALGLLFCVGGAGDARAAGPPLRLTAGSSEVGWTSLAVRGAPGATVELRELIGGRSRLVASLPFAGGTVALAHAARWRCGRRRLHFSATRTAADGSATTATASISTPSCAHRLHMIVSPTRLRPGRRTVVHVADAWHAGGISARVCARATQASAGCRRVRLAPGRATRVSRIRLPRSGSWTIALRSAHGQRLARHVDVRRSARVRVLVTGDSMIYGVYENLAGVLGPRGVSVHGDPHPATGISKEDALNWPAHARSSVRHDRPDATVVFLGAGEGYPMKTAAGVTLTCCGQPWIDEYARRAHSMMRSYLRGGRRVLYWVTVPAPEGAQRAQTVDAVNAAVRQAAVGIDDGLVLLDAVANLIAPDDRFEPSILYEGRRRIVRTPDGIHLAVEGIHIANAIIVRTLRAGGLVD